MPRMPESVGPYRVVDRLGGGGMGEVYRARDERLERWVAIKHIRQDDDDIRLRERLRREARAVAGLSHPAIVQVHDIVETDDGDWIVMELVEGRSLQEVIDEGSLEMSRVVELAQEIAEGLAEAHAKGIVHRDLKTENVMISDLGHAKILDFGLAKRVGKSDQEDSLSVQGAILGTSRAMSPEQVLGEEVDHRSDLFSFGTLLFETAAGRRPFVGSSLIITLAQVCTEEQPSAREVNPAVPQELSDLIDHLLQKDPLQRPQSAGEVVEVLQRIAGRMASHSASGGDPSDTAEAPVIPPTPEAAFRTAPPAPRASRGSGPPTSSITRASESTAGIFIKTLVQTALIDSARLGDRYGDARAYELFSRHDRLARDVLAEHQGLEIHKTDEGFLFLFERPIDAAGFVLEYHQQLAGLAAEVGVELAAGAAIHLSEVFLRENTPEEIRRGAKPLEVEGLAKLVVARMVTLARGGQTLLSQEAYDMTRRALASHRLAEREIHWLGHGRYLFRGVNEIVRLFEVSTEPIAADSRLPDTADAQRVAGHETHPRLRLRRPSRAVLAAAALVVVLAVSALLSLYGMRASPETLSAAAGLTPAESVMRASLVVLGFRNLGGSAEHDWLSTALSELLSSDLAAGEDLRLIPDESVARLKRSQQLFDGDGLAPDTLGKVRDQVGADYVILGSYLYLEEGKQLTVQMKLQDTRRGETFASVSQTGSEDELLELVSEAGDVVRAKLGLSGVSRANAQAVRATLSQDTAAYRLYIEALDKLHVYDALAARDILLQALEIDPDFALAHAALAETWLELGYDQEAAESASRAFQLARRRGLPREDHLLIEARYHEASGNWQKAIETHRDLWSFFPDDVDHGLRLAQVQVHAGLKRDALATVAALRRLPAPSRNDPRIDLVEATAVTAPAAAVKAAQRAINKGRSRGNWPVVAEAERLKGWALTDLGRLDEAAAALEEARRLFEEAGDEGGLGDVLFNLSYLLEGRRNLSEAEQCLREALDIFQKTGSRKKIARTQNGLAHMLQGQGRLAAAKEAVEEALAMVREIGLRERELNYLDTLAWVLVQMGDLKQAGRLGRELVALSQQLEHRRMEGWAYLDLAYVALFAGDLPQAESLLGEVLTTSQETHDQQVAALAHNVLGAVYYDMGELAKARQAFDQYWEMQAVGEWGEQPITEPRHALTLLEMGQPAEAADMAWRIAERYRKGDRSDYQAAALAVAARAFWEQGRREDARSKLAQAMELGQASEVADVRLRLAMTESYFLAAGDYHEASRRLRNALGQARQLGLKGAELDATLALARIEARFAPETGPATHSLARLRAVAEEAGRLGFGLIARHAKAEIARLEGSGSPAAPTGS